MLITNLLIFREGIMGFAIRGFAQIISFLILKHFSRLILQAKSFHFAARTFLLMVSLLELQQRVITNLFFV